MFRISMFLAIALGVIVTGSAVTPAAAFSSQVFGTHKEQIFPHYHAVNSPGNTRFRPPSKKRA
jgi:hypothetical protein